jgi:hypothetical protein
MLTRRHSVAVDDVTPAATSTRRSSAEYVPAAPAAERYELMERRVSRIPQIIGLLVGVAITVLGIAALARTGIDVDHIYEPRLLVWHLPHNQLFGMIETAFGLLVILSSIEVGGTRPALAFFGVVAFAFSLVVLFDVAPNHLYEWLGVTRRNGWMYLAVGLLLAIPALLTHDVIERRVAGETVTPTARPVADTY